MKKFNMSIWSFNRHIVVIFILTRCFYIKYETNYFKNCHYNILIVGILLSLMNFNAFIYLLQFLSLNIII